MNDRDDHDLCRFDPIVNGVGESLDKSEAQVLVHYSISSGIAFDACQRLVDRFDILRAEPGSLLILPVRGLVEFALSDAAHEHGAGVAHFFIRARAARFTSSHGTTSLGLAR